ncbi:MAG TPA: ATP-binding protein [Solirubrobacteraceae bacterium]|jgi:two-component sensor histidine kinase
MPSCERFLLAPDRRAVREARLHVRAFDQLPDEAEANAELVVSELVANSVLHARMDPEDRIEVTLRRESERLVIEVADGGAFSRRPGSRGGWGFKVLDAICECWSAEGGRVSASIAIAGGVVEKEAPRRTLRIALRRPRR